MAERARFEIYPQVAAPERIRRGAGHDGGFGWRFSIDGVSICSADQSFGSRASANDDIHEFMRAIDGAECGIHPDIIDVEET